MFPAIYFVISHIIRKLLKANDLNSRIVLIVVNFIFLCVYIIYSVLRINFLNSKDMVSKFKIRESILKATDCKLTVDNWQYILDVCDLIKDDPEELGGHAIKIIEERLEQDDGNVILRALSLLVSLAENCGSRLQQAISSKHFTSVLSKLVEKQDIHITIKKEIAKSVKQLSDSFKNDPSLKSMDDLYKKILRQKPYLLQEPEVSQKQHTSQNGLADDKDLEEALKLSLLEYEKQKDIKLETQKQHSTDTSNININQPVIVRKVCALYDLIASEPDELTFKKGDVITVVGQVYRDWWRGTLRGKVGIFPLNYVTPLTEATKESLQKDLLQEEHILSQSENIDRLLCELKTCNNSDMTQNNYINELYGLVTPLRPQITRAMGKYSQKKDDLISLRQILINSEAIYNQLLNCAADSFTSPMPHPSYKS